MKKAALFIVDMQNAFCSPKGSFIKRGYNLLNLEEVIENIIALLKIFQSQERTIIFTKLEFKADYSNAGLLVKKYPSIIEKYGYIESTWDSEIINNFKSFLNTNVIIISKSRYNPFIRTNLENILRGKKIEKVLLAGVLTNVCLESTARSAFDRDFEVEVIKDATTTYSNELYQSSLNNISSHFGKITTTKTIYQNSNSASINL